MRLTLDEIKSETKRVLVKYGMSEERTEICARIHMETTYDGVYSHGTNRVVRFVNYIQRGWVDVNAEPPLEREFGAFRVYNGNMGPGVLNALYCADWAMKLADQYDIGMVEIRNAIHWMRGGTYGLYAVRKGYAVVMWASTEFCMPPQGGRECCLGNNPFIMVAPSTDGGEPLQLDMAMSQCFYGKLQVTRLAGEKLPYPDGLGDEGNLTDDPGTIEQFRCALPVGYWKGPASSFVLDILGSVFADGIGAAGMDQKGYGSYGGCSQVIIVVDPGRAITDARMKEIVDTAVLYIKSSVPSEEGGSIRVPGQGSAWLRREHDRLGIYVDDDVWKKIQSLWTLEAGIRRFYP